MTRSLILFLLFTPAIVHASEADDATPTIEIGSRVFAERCVLCHGYQGMGEGLIPLKIKGYPDTNIMVPKKATTQEKIHQVIAMGGLVEGISQFMPPMGNELKWTELESVAMFVVKLRSDPEPHLALLEDLKESIQSEQNLRRQGRIVYQSRCTLCHGAHGEGDGRMAKVIKSPPPFDLTKSVLPKEYLSLIVTKGGAEVGRSGQMPPWGDQLNEIEIKAVIDYIISIRH